MLHGSPVSGGTSDDTPHEIDSEVGEKLRTTQGNLHLLLKPELSELCEILKLPVSSLKLLKTDKFQQL